MYRFFFLPYTIQTKMPAASTTKKTKPFPKFSGSERVCRRNVFSVPKGISRNNCYAYAIHAARWKGPSYKLQPGDLSMPDVPGYLDCDTLVERTRQDLKVIGGHLTPYDSRCKRGYYKIALILAPSRDYHFLVHHKDVVFRVTCDNETRASIAKKFKVAVSCVEKLASYAKGTSVYVKHADCWSHKRGTAFPVSLMDAKGKIIKDPRKANFDYGWLNYHVYCATFCVKKRPDMKACTVKNDTRGNMFVNEYDVATSAGIKRIISSLKKKMVSSSKTKK